MVRVELHYLVLCVVTFDLHREHPFVHLALDRLDVEPPVFFTRDKKVLGKLLSERRSALNFVAGEVLPGGADDADWIDTHMIVKARVLDCEDRVFHHRRNLFVFKWDALLERELSDHRLSIIGINPSHDTWSVRCERGDFSGRL